MSEEVAFINDSEEEVKQYLDLLKPGRFSITNFHKDFKDNTEKVLYALLSLQSNDKPLKKGSPDIAFRADAIIMANRQKFSNAENTLLDLIMGEVSSQPQAVSYAIIAREAKERLGYKDKAHAYHVIREATETLKGKNLIFEVPLKNGKIRNIEISWFEVLTYISVNDLDEDEDECYVSFTPTQFFRMLLISASVTNGAYYSVRVSSQIKSAHVRQLFYLLSSRKKYKAYKDAPPGQFIITLSELQKLIGYPASYRPVDVRRNILDPSYEMINNIPECDFVFEYSLIKEGKKTKSVKFYITMVIDNKKETKEETKETLSDDRLAHDMLKGQGLSQNEISMVMKKYKANKRDILFLNKVMIEVASQGNKIRHKAAMYAHYMDNGITGHGEEKWNFEQREYDMDEVEKRLLARREE